MDDLFARRRRTLMAAHDAGVAMYAGSDGGGVSRHGNLAGEVIAMRDLGFTAQEALGAASWRAREWLGWNADLAEGAPADFVVYPREPLADLSCPLQPRPNVRIGRGMVREWIWRYGLNSGGVLELKKQN